ncbi:MAG: hypothetical protein U0Q18_11005 [Bryobacteraceae bacterium]
MIIPVLALLAAASPQLRNGNFDDQLAGWSVHSHADSGPAAGVRIEPVQGKGFRYAVLVECPGSERAGVEQTLYLTPGSLWRLSARAKQSGPAAPAPRLEVETPSGTIGRTFANSADWSQIETTFRVPSPGEVAVHLDADPRRDAPSGCSAEFADVHLEPVAEPEPGELRIHLRAASKRPIDPKQQGQFVELLCRLIPSMLAQQVENDSFEDEPPFRFSYIKETDRPNRPWYPEGAVQVAEYSLDPQDPFNGKQSQKITIHLPHARAGIAQDGFYLKSGVRYRLRLHIKGDGGGPVRAVLRDSQGYVAAAAGLGVPAATWKPAEAVFTATRDSASATLAIEGEGPGALWLDRVYLIGDDAVAGLWRKDVVDGLRKLKPGIIRFGGTSIEGFEWEQTVGNWDTRAPFTTVWGGLESNFVGIDEFLRLCELVGAEPMICVRWTGKQPADAAAEIEYVNGRADSRWGQLRARNGHPRPYGVKYWQIGNEVGGAEYAESIAAFAQAMRAADPSIKLLSSYPRNDLLIKAGGQLDYLCPHHYEYGDMTEVATEFEALRKQIEAQGGSRDVRVAVTEWNTTGGDFGLKRGILQSLGNALDCSRYHNLLHRYADLVEIGIRSNLIDSFGSGILVTGPGWMFRAPTYYAEELYGRAAGSFAVRVERDSRLPWQLQQPDVSAALSADGLLLRVYAVNSTAQTIRPVLVLADGEAGAERAEVFVLKNREGRPDTEAMNSPSDREAISVERRSVAATGKRLPVTLAPYSLTLLEVGIRR